MNTWIGAFLVTRSFILEVRGHRSRSPWPLVVKPFPIDNKQLVWPRIFKSNLEVVIGHYKWMTQFFEVTMSKIKVTMTITCKIASDLTVRLLINLETLLNNFCILLACVTWCVHFQAILQGDMHFLQTSLANFSIATGPNTEMMTIIDQIILA